MVFVHIKMKRITLAASRRFWQQSQSPLDEASAARLRARHSFLHRHDTHSAEPGAAPLRFQLPACGLYFGFDRWHGFEDTACFHGRARVLHPLRTQAGLFFLTSRPTVSACEPLHC
jgi:hypothetical protein